VAHNDPRHCCLGRCLDLRSTSEERVGEFAGTAADVADQELHLCKFISGDVCIDKKLSVVGGDHNRLTFNSLRMIFPVSRLDVSIPSTESGNDVGSVAKGK
jgi:hypothetical protein